jgi:hypothetical protein
VSLHPRTFEKKMKKEFFFSFFLFCILSIKSAGISDTAVRERKKERHTDRERKKHIGRECERKIHIARE